VTTPAISGDALGELSFHSSLGREVLDEGLREFIVGRAIFVGHRRDLACEAVTERVHAGTLAARVRDRTVGQKRVIAVRFQLFSEIILSTSGLVARFFITMRDCKNRVPD
jgi:hypothetical protein